MIWSTLVSLPSCAAAHRLRSKSSSSSVCSVPVTTVAQLHCPTCWQSARAAWTRGMPAGLPSSKLEQGVATTRPRKQRPEPANHRVQGLFCGRYEAAAQSLATEGLQCLPNSNSRLQACTAEMGHGPTGAKHPAYQPARPSMSVTRESAFPRRSCPMQPMYWQLLYPHRADRADGSLGTAKQAYPEHNLPELHGVVACGFGWAASRTVDPEYSEKKGQSRITRSEHMRSAALAPTLASAAISSAEPL